MPLTEPAPTRRSRRPSDAPQQAPVEAAGSRAETRRRSMDAAPQRPATVWGRRHEQALEAPVAPVAVTSTTDVFETRDAAPVEQATRTDDSALPTSRRTRTSARAGVSAFTASHTAAPEPVAPVAPAPAAPAAPSSRSAARRARTAVEVAPIVPARVIPAGEAAAWPKPEPVMELRQVITTAPIALPEPAALPATPSIAAVPLVEAPRRSRIRPAASEPVASTAPEFPAPPVSEAAPAFAPAPVSETQSAPDFTAAPAFESTAAPEFTIPAEPAATTAPPVTEETWHQDAWQPRGTWQADPHVDEFEAAARAFSFTGETPIQQPAATAASSSEPVAHQAPRRPGKSPARRLAAASVSVGVMGIVGMLTVGMTTPAEAVAVATGTNPKAVLMVAAGTAQGGDVDDANAYVTSADAQGASFGATSSSSYGTLTAAQTGAGSGIRNVSNAVFTNNPNSKIQWPFAVGCTISFGFGWRPGEFHQGVDFTPGDGAHVQAIADGTVRISTDAGGNYGVTIVIDHQIDGKLVSSRYAHMQYGSRQVQVGDKVKVGEYIGRTGNTGMSRGAHTHLEILLGGNSPTDPLAWLRAHVTPL